MAPRKRGRPSGSSVSGGNRAGLDAARLDPSLIIHGRSKRTRAGIEHYTDCGPSTRLKDCAGTDLEALASDNESYSDEQQIRPHLDGSLRTLTKLLHKAHCSYQL